MKEMYKKYRSLDEIDNKKYRSLDEIEEEE
jgi:hypothetical protein